MEQESWKRDHNEIGCQQPEAPVLCTNGCGFFGSPSTMSLCFQCYRDVILKQAKESAPNAAEQANMAAVSLPEIVCSPETLATVTAEGTRLSKGKRPSVTAGVEEPERIQNRCASCRKRLGLTGFKCRCGFQYCAVHRYSDKHNCSFDYKKAGREAIAKANPVVKAEKIIKM